MKAMQQLTLFTNQTARRRRGRYHKADTRKAVARQHFTPDLWSQADACEQEMALFFLDIRDFTPLAEKHHPVDVIHIVKKIFTSFQNIIRIHHGRIIETSGDGFYAAFGFNNDITTAINDAVRAGKSILDTLRKLNENSLEKNLQRCIEVGIGIHAGKVATGNLMLSSVEHPVVMGYAVNIASRIQSATKALNNNFIISATAYDKLEDPAPEGTRMTVILKGLTDPVNIVLIGKRYDAPAHQDELTQDNPEPETSE